MRRAILALVVSLTAFGAQAQDTVLILDASNSMAARLDARPRIDVAREAVGGLGAALPATARLGLMAFGHRQAAHCGDIELLSRPGRPDPVAFAAAATLTPRGRSPLAESVAAASRVAPRVILVTDGEDTCTFDPCGRIRALRQGNPRLQVNIVGFDLRTTREAQLLRCMAEAGGGRFIPATTGADLARALAELAGAPAGAATTAPAARGAAPGLTTLVLEAAEDEGGDAGPVGDWTLLSLATDPPRAVFSGSAQARPRLRVAPGRYEVRLRAGAARAVERFEVSGAQQTHRVVLGLGTLRPTGFLAPDVPARIGQWTVWADEVPGFRFGEQVATGTGDAPTLRLTAGSYWVRFRAGEAATETGVVVVADQAARAVLNLDAGIANLALRRGTALVAPQFWELRRADVPALRSSFAEPQPRLILPAGAWVVRARVDDILYEVPLTVEAGRTTTLDIPVR